MKKVVIQEKRLKELLILLKTEDKIKKEEALHELIKLMQPRLRTEAIKFLKDTHEAESTVNFIFAKLWNKANLFNENKPAMPYVISVLRNLCRDILKKKSNRLKSIETEYIKDYAKTTEIELSHDFAMDNLKLDTAFKVEDMLKGTYNQSISGLFKEVKLDLNNEREYNVI